jgi:hypothetical protein
MAPASRETRGGSGEGELPPRVRGFGAPTMTNKFDRVLLYIGPPKTGTTSIESFLWKNRDALRAQGLYIPLAGRKGLQHVELPYTLGRQRKKLNRLVNLEDGDRQFHPDILRSRLDRELATVTNCHTLLMFGESMFATDPEEIPNYKAFFSRYAPRLECLMYLRRQDQWLASLTLQSRKSGTSAELALAPGSPERYEKRVRGWDAQIDRCHIRRFDSDFFVNNDLLVDFCDAVGVDYTQLEIDTVRNQSLFQEDIELVDALNKQMTTNFSRKIAYRSRFVALCAETIDGTQIEFPRAAAQAAFESFNSLNTWLRDTRDPEGPERFFNADFSRYPEEPRNDKRYTEAQLRELISAIEGKMRDRDLEAPVIAGDAPRSALIDHIITTFLLLRRSELRENRLVRIEQQHAQGLHACGAGQREGIGDVAQTGFLASAVSIPSAPELTL